MPSTKSLVGLVGLLAVASTVAADDQVCGTTSYDPAKYVCHDNTFLCPIVAGEGLSYCAGACYSTYMYTCSNNELALLPKLADGTLFTVTAANPADATVDGQPITACGQQWHVGGSTCSYCPSTVGASCPAGTETVFSWYTAGGVSLDVVVPGGQAIFEYADNTFGYTQAHSASIPQGANPAPSLAAYGNGGGLVDTASGGYGWVACPNPSGVNGNTAPVLVSLNADNKDLHANCTPLNLKINAQPAGTVGAWQYT